MNDFQKNIAALQGEVIAARLLASAAIQSVIAIIPDSERQRFLEGMSAWLDDSLNVSGPATGDGQSEFHTEVREKARFHATHALDAIRSGLRSGPAAR